MPFADRLRQHLKATCADVCQKLGTQLREFVGEEDNVDLLFGYPPKLSICRLVDSQKLVSDRLLRKRNLSEVRRPNTKSITGGWRTYYWKPLMAYLEG